MAGIFKAYDIRGIYGKTFNEEIIKKIGRAFATFLGCRKVVIAKDMRPHSAPLFEALAEGLTLQGADVIDVGMCSTPMCYFATASLGADAGIMITASHNPGEWNGVKLTREQAIPISGDTGIKDIERIVTEGAFADPASRPGTISSHDIVSEYVAHVHKVTPSEGRLSIVADMANAMGIIEARAITDQLDVTPMYDALDGSFPNHEANPLKTETLTALQDKVRSGDYAFGVAFDGDADRAGFVDETGAIVPMDRITALIAQDILRRKKGVVFYDLRSSWAVREIIEENGGTAMMSRVGHAFIKQQMRDHDALFAGELSGHYYFKDNYYTESSAMAILAVANIISRSGHTLSELVDPIERYTSSGEINSEVPDTDAVLSKIRNAYADGRIITLDGVSVEYDDWWFNVRASNTEPLIRLNLEARDAEQMASKRDEVLALIRSN